MKAAIYQWVRLLAAFYILFTAVLQLMPDQKYERYIRSFMGLLLIYMLCTPMLSLLKNSGEIISDFADHYQKETAVLDQKETQNLQGFYIRKGFQRELSGQIAKKCKDAGIKVQEAIVNIEGEQIAVVLKMAEVPGREVERRIQDELRQGFGIEEQNLTIRVSKDGETAVGCDTASGTSSVGDRASGIPKEQRTEADDTDSS